MNFIIFTSTQLFFMIWIDGWRQPRIKNFSFQFNFLIMFVEELDLAFVCFSTLVIRTRTRKVLVNEWMNTIWKRKRTNICFSRKEKKRTNWKNQLLLSQTHSPHIMRISLRTGIHSNRNLIDLVDRSRIVFLVIG